MPRLPLRLSALFLLFAVLAGCHSTPECVDNPEYLRAVDRPRLQMPEGVGGSERLAPLVIPPVAPDPAKLDPQPRCLDEPPAYFARKGRVADSAEEAVNAWAAAWAARKADAVIQLYSPTFQAPGESGSAAFLDQRKQQVETGRAPAPQLEEVTVNAVGADRRVVTFVQRFGDDRIRKELTLVHEKQGWRIVSERTIEVL